MYAFQHRSFVILIPKVKGTVNRLQDLAMEAILGVDWLPGSADVQNLAFAWIKFHVTGMIPFL